MPPVTSTTHADPDTIPASEHTTPDAVSLVGSLIALLFVGLLVALALLPAAGL